MKKSVLITLFLILLIIPVAFAFSLGGKEVFSLNKIFSDFFNKLTGSATTSNTCADSDNGKDYYVLGTVKGTSNSMAYSKTDKCIDANNLYEFYCSNNNWVRETYTCPDGCSNGACLQTTTQENVTRCTDSDKGINIFSKGTVNTLVVNGTDYCNSQTSVVEYYCNGGAPTSTDGTPYADINLCPNGCKDGACLILTNTTIAKEEIQCNFHNSNLKQECYSNKGSCSGVNSCLVDISGMMGEQVTWKSSCGGYMYTTLDGQSEIIGFNCANVNTNTTNQTNPPIPNCAIIKSGGGFSYNYTIPSDPTFCFESCIKDTTRLLQITNVDMTSNRLTIKVVETGEVYKDLPFTLDQPTKLNDIDSRIILTIDQSSITLNQRVDCVLGPIVELTDEWNTCIFKGSNTIQTCYSNGIYQGSCSGIGSCIIHNGGLMGENLTWKSTCGGYGYTKMDGIDENIEFDCTNINQTTVSTCLGIPEINDLDPCINKVLTNYGFVNNTQRVESCVNKMSIYSECTEHQFYYMFIKCLVNEYPDLDKPISSCLSNVVQPPITKCYGCFMNENCIPYGTRVKGSYCDLNGNIIPQKQANEFCENSYECDSNLCISSKCVSSGLWDRFVKWFSRFFSR